jgi:hypothetical protein
MVVEGNIESVDVVRKQIDSLSYNIKKIFCENCQEVGIPGNPVDFTEFVVNTIDELVALSTVLTHTNVLDSDLPSVNSVISSYRWVALELRKMGDFLKNYIAEEYFKMYLSRLHDLEESADDLDMIFFQLKDDQEFNDLTKELEGL